MKLDIFKHIVFYLKEWYKDSNELDEDEFNNNNDFSILKLIKLQFFVSAVNSDSDSEILDYFDFYALPYGPVESSTYNSLKEGNNLDFFTFENYSITTRNQINLPEIPLELKRKISKSVNDLKSIEPRLINAEAGELVDLSHKWNCWKKNYALARARKKYSAPMPDSEIKNDIKIFNLDLL